MQAQIIRKNWEGTVDNLLHFVISVNEKEIPLVTMTPLHSLCAEYVLCGFGFELADCSPDEVQAVLHCYSNHARFLDIYFRACQQFERYVNANELSDLLEWDYLSEREIAEVTHKHYMQIDNQYRDEVVEYNKKQERAKKDHEKKQRENRQTYLYLMRDNRTNDVKIGHGKVPVYRERTLQSEQPDIDLIIAWRAAVPEEKKLHKEFAGKRKRGEWFVLTDEDIENIKARFVGREQWNPS